MYGVTDGVASPQEALYEKESRLFGRCELHRRDNNSVVSRVVLQSVRERGRIIRDSSFSNEDGS